MEIKRNSTVYLAKQMLSQMPSVVPAWAVLFVIVKLSLWLSLLLCGLYVLVRCIIIFFQWNANTFYIEDDVFYNKCGLFNKKTIKIPLHQISAVDLKTPFSYRIFGLTILVIDRGIVDEIEDITYVMSKKNAVTFRNQLLAIVSSAQDIDTTESDVLYTISRTNLAMFALTRRAWVTIMTFLISLGGIFFENDIKLDIDIMAYIKIISGRFLFWLVILAIASKLLGMIITLIKYYKFSIVKNGDKLDLSQGWLSKSLSSISIDKVCSVKIDQTLWQKLLKKATVSVSTAGYGDGVDEDSIVFPYIDENAIESTIKAVFPKFHFDGELYSINPHYKLRRRNARIGYTDKLLYFSGGIIGKRSTIIDMDVVGEITIKQSPFQARHNAYTLKSAYHTMSVDELHGVRGIDLIHCENVKNIINNGK